MDALRADGKRDQARQRCIRGFRKTLQEAPGIAFQLRERLRQMAEEEKKFDLAAAYRADEFFEQPSAEAYRKVRQAAEKIKAWPAVRSGLLEYLQSGRQPQPDSTGTWPLPAPEVRQPKPKAGYREQFPNQKMLIEIALLEKRHDDAVALYQQLPKTGRWGWSIDEQLAEAVAGSHPEMALQIWGSIATRTGQAESIPGGRRVSAPDAAGL